jgi:2-polyprenyl-3-methyl-5-hydroxy-6-metoxy-1,4-benzoquinol methylase
MEMSGSILLSISIISNKSSKEILIMKNNSTETHYLSVESEDLDTAFNINPVYAHTYLETKIKAVRELGLTGSDSVLDVGCGQGHLLRLISKSNDSSEQVGIDLSLTDLKKAKKHDTGRNCEFVLGDAAHLPFKDSGFQKVVCTAVLEHVTDEQEVMNDLGRVLKDEGILVIDVPGAFHLQNKLSDLFIKRQGIFPFHREYTRDRMEGIIRKTGFELESFSTARFVGSLLFPMVETVATFSGRKIVWCKSNSAKIVCWMGDRISILCGSRRYFKLLGGSWFFKLKKNRKKLQI